MEERATWDAAWWRSWEEMGQSERKKSPEGKRARGRRPRSMTISTRRWSSGWASARRRISSGRRTRRRRSSSSNPSSWSATSSPAAGGGRRRGRRGGVEKRGNGAGRLRDGSRREKNERNGGREPRVRMRAATEDRCGFGRSSSIGRFEAFASTCDLRGGGRPKKNKRNTETQPLVFEIIVSRLIFDGRSSNHEALVKAYKRGREPMLSPTLLDRSHQGITGSGTSRFDSMLPYAARTLATESLNGGAQSDLTHRCRRPHLQTTSKYMPLCRRHPPPSRAELWTAQPTYCSLQRVIAYVTVYSPQRRRSVTMQSIRRVEAPQEYRLGGQQLLGVRHLKMNSLRHDWL